MKSPDQLLKVPRQAPRELTRDRLQNLQTLEVTVDEDLEGVLEQVREMTGQNLESRPNGYHVTIIGPSESKMLSTLDEAALAELQEISASIQQGDGIIVTGIGYIDGASGEYHMRAADTSKKTAFITLDIPALQHFRSKVGLPPKDFHITLGFITGDIHMHIVGQEPVKPGSPKMKDITEPIPKKPDAKFSTIEVPNLAFGGLDGQEKQRKES